MYVARFGTVLLWIQSSFILSEGIIQIMTNKTKGLMEGYELISLLIISISIFISAFISDKHRKIEECLFVIIFLILMMLFFIFKN